MSKAEYRIVTDNYCGFEVQFRTRWWPFWRQIDFANTNLSLEMARARALSHAKARCGIVVENLGSLP